MTTITDNPFAKVIQDVENAPNNQKLDTAFQGIAKQMQQQNTNSLQLGQELQQIKAQLVKACSQQQGG